MYLYYDTADKLDLVDEFLTNCRISISDLLETIDGYCMENDISEPDYKDFIVTE